MAKEKRYNKFDTGLLCTTLEDTLLKPFHRCKTYDNAESVEFCYESHQIINTVSATPEQKIFFLIFCTALCFCSSCILLCKYCVKVCVKYCRYVCDLTW